MGEAPRLTRDTRDACEVPARSRWPGQGSPEASTRLRRVSVDVNAICTYAVARP